MNYQREAVYSRRRNALSGERIEIDVMNMMLDEANIIVENDEGLPFEAFQEDVMAQLSIEPGFDAEFYDHSTPQDKARKLFEHMQEVYRRRMDTMEEKVYPFIKEVYEKQGSMYENIALPISDGKKGLNLSVPLKKAYENQAREIEKSLSRTLILWQIDDHWKEHLREMDDLRQSVQNAAYEQKDPLVVYKLESYNLFSEMLQGLNKDVLRFLLRSFIPLRDSAEDQGRQRPNLRQAAASRRTDMSRMQASRSQLSTNGEQKSNTPVRVDKKVGRNDPCPCGSGLKYKNCHGKGIV